MSTITEVSSSMRAERNRVNYSREQVAAMTGISVSSLNNWENAKSEPSASAIKRLARCYGCTANELIGFK